MLPEAGLFSDCSVGKKNPNEQKILSSQSKIIILSPHFQFFSHVSEPKHPTVCSALISNIYLLAPVIIIRELQNNGSETATKKSIYIMVQAEYHLKHVEQTHFSLHVGLVETSLAQFGFRQF